MVAKEIPVLTRHQSEEDVSVELKEEFIKEKDIKKEAKDEDEKTDEKGEESKEENKEPEAPQGIDVDPSKLPKYNSSVVIGE